jgi:hypothetical protein
VIVAEMQCAAGPQTGYDSLRATPTTALSGAA